MGGELLPGLPDAILFGLIAGGVLLLLIMIACCFYFIRSSFSDSGLPASTSYRDNAMAARANTVAGQSGVFSSPANSAVFNPNANSGVFFGGGGGGFGAQQQATISPQRSQTFAAQKASPRGNDDVERDSVHRGYAFPGSMAASAVHEPELDLPNEDGEFDVNTDELVPQDVGGVYSSKPVVTKPPVKKASAKKPQFVCDDCGAEYYWETDLAAHQRKRH
jgi:hypothetical protein